MKKLLHIPVIIAALSLFLAGTGVSAEQKHDIVLRVSIVDDKDRVSLDLKGRYKIYAINSDRVVMEGPYFSSVVTAQKEGLKIGKKDIKLSGVKVKVDKDANIYVNSRRFRGDMDIIRKDNGKLVVVNHIPIDDYLYGVLYHEVSHRWPAEVLKAQAITARTFALYQARQNKLQPYDLRSDIYSQVYGGRASEKWSTTRAVDLTRNEALTYKGDIIPTYYHATCAGYTEDASNLWNIDAPYLKGAPCDYCRDSKHYRWTKEMPLWELANKLKNGGYKLRGKKSFATISANVITINDSFTIDGPGEYEVGGVDVIG